MTLGNENLMTRSSSGIRSWLSVQRNHEGHDRANLSGQFPKSEPMTETPRTHAELWKELPAFRDAESCVGAGITWAIKLTHPKLEIPSNVEAKINGAKLGKCKENIPLSWILGSLEVFDNYGVTIYVENEFYLGELRSAIPEEFSDRIDVELGKINSEEIKSGKYGVSALLVDKYNLDGVSHVVHTIVVDPKTAGEGDWITFSDPWTGKDKRMLPNNQFDKAVQDLNNYLGWGKILVSVRPDEVVPSKE